MVLNSMKFKHVMLLAGMVILFLHCGGTTQFVMVGNQHYDNISSVDYASSGKIDHPVKVSVVAFENKTHYGRRQLETVTLDILSNELVESKKIHSH